ncbi:hypothetical protein RJ55_05451 [Drechmeria coniospora]|nr:hypothetical protein RJ55_05451 [Drechmeria coniospora]
MRMQLVPPPCPLVLAHRSRPCPRGLVAFGALPSASEPVVWRGNRIDGRPTTISSSASTGLLRRPASHAAMRMRIGRAAEDDGSLREAASLAGGDGADGHGPPRLEATRDRTTYRSGCRGRRDIHQMPPRHFAHEEPHFEAEHHHHGRGVDRVPGHARGTPSPTTVPARQPRARALDPWPGTDRRARAADVILRGAAALDVGHDRRAPGIDQPTMVPKHESRRTSSRSMRR